MSWCIAIPAPADLSSVLNSSQKPLSSTLPEPGNISVRLATGHCHRQSLRIGCQTEMIWQGICLIECLGVLTSCLACRSASLTLINWPTQTSTTRRCRSLTGEMMWAWSSPRKPSTTSTCMQTSSTTPTSTSGSIHSQAMMLWASSLAQVFNAAVLYQT